MPSKTSFVLLFLFFMRWIFSEGCKVRAFFLLAYFGISLFSFVSIIIVCPFSNQGMPTDTSQQSYRNPCRHSVRVCIKQQRRDSLKTLWSFRIEHSPVESTKDDFCFLLYKKKYAAMTTFAVCYIVVMFHSGTESWSKKGTSQLVYLHFIVSEVWPKNCQLQSLLMS